LEGKADSLLAFMDMGGLMILLKAIFGLIVEFFCATMFFGGVRGIERLLFKF
jgi:hypothetical protein